MVPHPPRPTHTTKEPHDERPNAPPAALPWRARRSSPSPGSPALGSIFDYPKILKEPTDEILAAYRADQAAISAWFLVLVISAALLAPIGILLGRLAGGSAGRWIAGLGIAAAAVQVDRPRWHWSRVDASSRHVGTDTFELLHTWLGEVLGETIGYALTATFTLFVVRAITGTALAERRSGYASAALIATGVVIPIVEGASLTNFAGYVLWCLWLIAMSVVLWRASATQAAWRPRRSASPESYASHVLAISVLDSVAVTRDGVVVAVPSGKTSELLVRLAVDAGSLVRTERLVEDLWGDTAVSTQRNTLQSKVSQLRKALGDSALVVGTSDGYRLDVEPASIDVHAVLDDAVAAQQSLDAGDLERAAACAAGRSCKVRRRAVARGRRLGDPASGAAERDAARAARDVARGPSALGRSRCARRPRGRGRGASVPRAALDADDHRALPVRSPGGRAGRLRTRSRDPRRRARARTRTRAARPGAPHPHAG